MGKTQAEWQKPVIVTLQGANSALAGPIAAPDDGFEPGTLSG